MKIEIHSHALLRALDRGTNKTEITDVLHTGVDVPVRHGRQGKARVYEFGQKRHGTYYDQKRVEVIYTKEDDTIIVVTVYVFYETWEKH